MNSPARGQAAGFGEHNTSVGRRRLTLNMGAGTLATAPDTKIWLSVRRVQHRTPDSQISSPNNSPLLGRQPA